MESVERRTPIIVPPTFAEHRMRVSGDAGAMWIAELPSVVEELMHRWNLTQSGPPRHGLAALALPVRRDADDLVLKVAYPQAEAIHERLALAAWNGNGAVLLHQSDPRLFALLMERLVDSRTLKSIDPVEATEVAAMLIRRHAVPAPVAIDPYETFLYGIAHYVEEALERNLAELDPRVLRRTLKAIEAFDAPDKSLVNVDMHFENVLAARREPWAVIDPKPLAGPPELAVTQILLSNPAGTDYVRTLDRIADVASLDSDLARRWACVHAVDIMVDAVYNRTPQIGMRCQELLKSFGFGPEPSMQPKML